VLGVLGVLKALPVKTPAFAFEFSSFPCRGLKRQFTSRASLSVGELTVKEEPHLDFVSCRTQLGVDCLMQFS
jgi:hypothetical protein